VPPRLLLAAVRPSGALGRRSKRRRLRSRTPTFRQRPFGPQLGALVSYASEINSYRAFVLEARARRASVGRYASRNEVPRAGAWGCYRVVPDSIEFWQSPAQTACNVGCSIGASRLMAIAAASLRRASLVFFLHLEFRDSPVRAAYNSCTPRPSNPPFLLLSHQGFGQWEVFGSRCAPSLVLRRLPPAKSAKRRFQVECSNARSA